MRSAGRKRIVSHHAQAGSVPDNMATSTGFDYFGICDITLPAAPAHIITTPAPAITPHAPGTWRTYQETAHCTQLDKQFVSVFREDATSGYLLRKKRTKVDFMRAARDKAWRHSYSNKGSNFMIRLMPEGHPASPI